MGSGSDQLQLKDVVQKMEMHVPNAIYQTEEEQNTAIASLVDYA